MPMTKDRAFFKAFDDTRIHYQIIAAPRPRALVVIVHGIGEHSGRYSMLADFFAARNCPVFLYDHRGHGYSQGQRGHVRRFGDYLQDLQRMVELAQEAYPGLPVLLFGHSMGGVVAALYALDHQDALAGLALSSPGFIPLVNIPAWKQLAAAGLAVVKPACSFSSGLSASLLSHDLNEVDKYLADPLNHGQVSARWALEFQKAGRECLKRAGEMCLPLLIIHGQDDQIVASQGSQDFFRLASSSNKEIALLPDLYHECFHELPPGPEQAYRSLDEWLQSVLGNLHPLEDS